MSQIGRMPIIIPENVEIINNDNNITVKGKLGNLEFKFDSNLDISISENHVLVSRNSDNKIFGHHGTYRFDPRQSTQMARAVSRFTSLSGCLDYVRAFWPPDPPYPGALCFPWS